MPKARTKGAGRKTAPASKTVKPEKQRKMGRPTLYSEEVAADICAHIASNKSLTSYCRQSGKPGLTTVFNWLAKHPEFVNLYAHARETQADMSADEIVEIADTEPDPNKARVRIDARKWTAAKLKPKKYGDRLTLDGDLKVTMTDEQLDARLAHLTAKAGTPANGSDDARH